MAKHSQTTKSNERPYKKVKIAKFPEGKVSTKAKPSPHKTTSQNLETELSIHTSTKGKEKESPTTSKSKKNKGKSREGDHQLPTSFKVVAGSYEKLLYGLDGTVTFTQDSGLKFELKPTFIFPAHVSCIKAVAASPHGGKWLATGSADEIIKVWDLRRRKEIGGLMHHEGSITHLLFPSRSHLLSASEDGTLCLFRARDWAVLRSLKGHKGRVNSVAVHPSGKVALSVGKDRALRMWDLMRGKGVASTKLGKEGEIVRWSSDGSKFAVQSGSTIDMYTTNMDLIYTITHPSRIHDVKFCCCVGSEREILLVGAEDHKVSVYDISNESGTPTTIAEMTGHTNRVKAMQTLEIALPESSGRLSTTLVCTVSSDGFIKIYDLASVPSSSSTQKTEIKPLVSYDSKGTRLTCVTFADGTIESVAGLSVDGKRKRDEDDDGHADEDDDSEADDEMRFDDDEEDEEELEGEEELELDGEDEDEDEDEDKSS